MLLIEKEIDKILPKLKSIIEIFITEIGIEKKRKKEIEINKII